MKILLIDNYDSFTYNLVHYLQIAGAKVDVVYNTELINIQTTESDYDGIVISPGPCTPQEAGDLMSFVNSPENNLPILGICLGMQAIGLKYGWQLKHAKIPVHGKAKLINHSEKGIFKGIKTPMPAGRYHSLIIEPIQTTALEIHAECEDEIMAIATKDNYVWAVQFHPESILTPFGINIVANWLELIAGLRKQ